MSEVQTKTDIIRFEELSKNELLQRVIVVEHFFRKKGVVQLSQMFNINPIDLRFFLNTVEAMNIYRELEDEFENNPSVSGIQEFEQFLIYKTMEILDNASPRDVADLVDRVVPQILNINTVVHGGRPSQKQEVVEAVIIGGDQNENEEQMTLQSTFTSPIQLIKESPQLLSKEDMTNIVASEEIMNKLKEEDDIPKTTETKD